MTKLLVLSGAEVLGVVVLNDPDTGKPIALMDGAVITGRRTAATSALSARVLACADAATVGIIGSGLQARTHLEAPPTVRPIRQVRVCSRTYESARLFASPPARAGRIRLSRVPSSREALQDADTVICATTSAEPVLRREWLKPAAHLCAVGSHSRKKRELDSETVAGCAVIAADKREGCLAEADDVRVPIAEGRLRADRVVELGAILLGQASGRTSDQEITWYKSIGMAAMDAAAARLVYDNARRSGVGTEVTL